MADNNKCYFEGTIWQPQTKTSTNGTTTWSAKLSVYKSKAKDGTYQYTQLFLRAYGAMADKLSKEYKERDKIAVNTTYRSEEWQGKYYNFFQVNEIVEPEPVVNNSPYAQSYRRSEQQPKPQPAQDLFTKEIPDARPVQEEDELPF